MAYVVLKGMTSGYQVKQLMLQCAAAGAPQASRISSPYPCCNVDPNETLWLESTEECWCLSRHHLLSQARLTHSGGNTLSKGSDFYSF